MDKRTLRHSNFKESDVTDIANVLNCKLDVTLKFNDTGDKF